MREIALFVEDHAHQQVIEALLKRISGDYDIGTRLEWRSSMGGHARVFVDLDDYMRDLARQGSPRPDLIIVATDGNCQGLRHVFRSWQSP